jgi:hypothetical protein
MIAKRGQGARYALLHHLREAKLPGLTLLRIGLPYQDTSIPLAAEEEEEGGGGGQPRSALELRVVEAR